MRKWILITLILLVFSLERVISSEEIYKGLSTFTRVLDLVEKNYVEGVDSEKLMVGAIEGMLKTLDPYSAYLTPERYRELEIGTSGEFGGVGMEITVENGILTVISPIEGTPADKAGIKPGDQILTIEDKPTQGMSVEEAVRLLRGSRGSKVKLTIKTKDSNSVKEITLTRDIVHVKSVSSKSFEGNIGYAKITQFQEKTSEELREAINKLQEENKGALKGLIMDIRNNPGGLLNQAVEVADEFLDGGIIVSVKGRGGAHDRDYFATKNEKSHTYPLVVLINKGSASASEIVAGALQDHKRAVIVGIKTFGKGSVQTIIKLEDGSGLKLTTARFYTPGGKSIHEVGVTPDVVVEEDKGGKDSQLDRALEVIKVWDIMKTASK